MRRPSYPRRRYTYVPVAAAICHHIEAGAALSRPCCRIIRRHSTPFKASTMSIFRFFRATMIPTNSDTPKVSATLTM